MPTPFTSSGHGSGVGSAGAPHNGSRSGAAGNVGLAIDNMLRNQLRISNPRDPKQIAQGLAAYYQDLPQTAAISQEAAGLPFQQIHTLPMALPRQPSSSDTEFNIANGDVERALQDLGSNPLTNDITPEMGGWSDSIRVAVAEGKTAAQSGLDPTNRDKVIAMRRQLGEYARLARFVGSLSPDITQNFRRLGRGLDEVSAVLLVMLGESLASVGFATGYYLLQVPLPELQQRRDAVIFALRNFAGGAQQAYGPDDWPRGIDAYRRVYQWLEAQGQGDLRSLLLENEVARTMDALITRAQNGTADGLRALGVTAQIDIERFRRMAIVAPGALADEEGRRDRSPPLEAYLQALDLFAETFRPAGGLRLLRIARPPILYYGLYKTSQLEHDNALFELVAARGTLATIFDGLFPSNAARGVQPQVLLDMLLLELDRGIDLLALSSDESERGPTSWRAYALWAIIRVILNVLTGQYLPTPPLPPNWWTMSGQPSGGAATAQQLAGPIANYAYSQSGPVTPHQQRIAADLPLIYSDFINATANVPGFSRTFQNYQAIPLTAVPNKPQGETMRSIVEELQVQLTLEQRWENLVSTLAIEAGDQASVFELLRLVIRQAGYDVLNGVGVTGAAHLPTRYVPPLPPQFEQSLAYLVRTTTPSHGGG
jgi:hypothetical protein